MGILYNYADHTVGNLQCSNAKMSNDRQMPGGIGTLGFDLDIIKRFETAGRNRPEPVSRRLVYGLNDHINLNV